MEKLIFGNYENYMVLSDRSKERQAQITFLLVRTNALKWNQKTKMKVRKRNLGSINLVNLVQYARNKNKGPFCPPKVNMNTVLDSSDLNIELKNLNLDAR